MTARTYRLGSALVVAGLTLAVVACGAGSSEESGTGISKSEACEQARALVNALTSDAVTGEDGEAHRDTFRAELQEIVDRANREGADALQPWLDVLNEENAQPDSESSSTSGSTEAEEQKQLGLSVKACGWIFDPSTARYLAPRPLDAPLDASSSVEAYVQEACLTRLRIQRLPVDEEHLREAIPDYRAIEQTSSRGLEIHPGSDDLRALGDWARGLALKLENAGKVADEILIDLSHEVASLCDEALQSLR